MSTYGSLIEAVATRTAQHVSGSPLTEDNQMALAEVLQKGKVIGMHADPDGRMVLVASDRRRDGSRAYSLRWFDGDLAKGALMGSKVAMVREFERRTGQPFGLEPMAVDEKPAKVTKTLNRLMKAIDARNRLTVNRRPAGKGLT